jgi:anhydro-N-acetylmuramic acid kinase
MSAMPRTLRVIGLMSGTSLDGVDAAIVDFEGNTTDALDWRVVAFHTVPYSAEQRREIHTAIERGTAADLCRLHARLGEWLAAGALAVCERAGVARASVQLIGSHGQTVWHDPPSAAERGATLQLGCAATIAERTGTAVVSDFRSRDVAAGGEGAPLVPWADHVLFASADRRRVLQNIGGMANLTWLPPRGSASPVLAFDTGPGNALIDAAVELATRGADSYDRDGHWAKLGTIDEPLLAELLAHPFHARTPPKSTGREVFGRGMVQSIVARLSPAAPEAWANLIVTLTAYTARSITDAIERWVLPLGVDEVIITGGGARNPVLMQLLRARLAPIPVHDGAALGVDAEAKEAVAFAALAWAHVHGVPGNVPAATGARGTRILGSFTPAGTPDARH